MEPTRHYKSVQHCSAAHDGGAQPLHQLHKPPIVVTETSGAARRQLHTTAHKHRHVLRHGFRGRDTRHSQPARQLPQHHSAKTEGGVHPCAHGRHDVARSSRQDGGVGCHGRQAGKEGSRQGDTTFQFHLPHGLCHHTAHCSLGMGSVLKND